MNEKKLVDRRAEYLVSPFTPDGIFDVVVIGAGPVGLATAIGLRLRGIENLLVIDRTRAFRRVGQVVDLLPNGLKALKFIAPKAYEEVKKTALGLNNSDRKEKPQKTSSEWVYKNLKGQRLRSISLEYQDWFKNYGEGRVSTSWYDLQTTLRHLLPEELVKANHRCVNVVEEVESGCVRVDCVSDIEAEANPYAHWEEGQKPDDTQTQNLENNPQRSQTKLIRARLVIAADGINSTVRQALYKDGSYNAYALPEYSGFAAIACREIALESNELQTELEEKFLQGSRIVTVSNDEVSEDSACMEDSRMMLFRSPNGQYGYVIHAALPLDSLREKSGSALIDLAMQKLEKADFPSVLKELIEQSPPANMRQRPYYIHRAIISDSLQLPSTAQPNTGVDTAFVEPAWSARRVVLVGDAAHGMPPFMAQGANQGFEDAVAIVTLVADIAKKKNWDDTTAITETFGKYDRLRRPLMVRIQQATLRRFSSRSETDWQEYSQQVYCRNFDREMEALH